MAPILGIYASQISGHLFAPSGAYDSIATTTVGAGGASTITFSSIPQTYTHLQIRGISRNNSGGGANDFGGQLRFNSDSGNNYNGHTLYGTGSSAAAYAFGQGTFAYAFDTSGSAATSNAFSVSVIDILDYANTNKNTTLRQLGGYDGNDTNGIVRLMSAVWMNTAAVTSITLDTGGYNFAQYSQFALYGIKSA